MTTTSDEAVFIDTNILIFAQQRFSPFHAVALSSLQQLASLGHPLYVSRQVLREYLAGMSRTLMNSSSVTMSMLIADIVTFEKQFMIAEDTALLTKQLLSLMSIIPCAGKQVHDANIVATMLSDGVSKLLTHNVSDFQRYSSLITILPLLPTP